MRLVSNFQTLFRSSKRDERINKIGDEAPATAISAIRWLMSRSPVKIPSDGGVFGFLHEGAVGGGKKPTDRALLRGADIRMLTGNASVGRGAANQRATLLRWD